MTVKTKKKIEKIIDFLDNNDNSGQFGKKVFFVSNRIQNI